MRKRHTLFNAPATAGSAGELARSPQSKSVAMAEEPEPVINEATRIYLEATQAERDAITAEFRAATASLHGKSPLQDLFLRVADADPRLTTLDLTAHPEMRSWMPPRQIAALRTLLHNPFVVRLVLSSCSLDDSVAPTVVELMRCSRNLASISLERNDFREAGLLLVAGALAENTTLLELKLNHQRFTVTSAVEEALQDVLHSKRNTTLCKLGLVVRNAVPRNRIEAALAANTDAIRKARVSTNQRNGSSGRGAGGGGSSGGGGGGGSGEAVEPPSARPPPDLGALLRRASAEISDSKRAGTPGPRKRQLSEKFAGFAGTLGATLAPFDLEGTVAGVEASRLPPEEDGRVFNLNNDVKFAKLRGSDKLRLVRAFTTNTVAVGVSMANLQLDDEAAIAWGEVLKANDRIASLNLEGNRIATAGISALAGALRCGCGLRELRLDHQVGGITSESAELELARAVESTSTLQKLSYSCRHVQARDIVNRTLMRNRDVHGRQRRLSRRRDADHRADESKRELVQRI